jgi:hypothetical protein
MTNKFENFDSSLCDKLFDFIYPNEMNMTEKEVQAELQRLNIDTTASMNKIRTALQKANERRKAQESLAVAKLKRQKMLEMLKNIGSTISGGREELKQWITEHLNGSEQAVFCRKLEETSDQDLKSLVDDILRLKGLGDSFDNEK